MREPLRGVIPCNTGDVRRDAGTIALRFFDARLGILPSSYVLGNCEQQKPGVVGKVFPYLGAGEIHPLVNDAVHVLLQEFGDGHRESLASSPSRRQPVREVLESLSGCDRR